MKRILLDHVICPACLPRERPLQEEIVEERQEDILEGNLSCASCGAFYPIRDGIAFLDPSAPAQGRPVSKYETESVLASYLWSHFGDLFDDGEASTAYSQWAAQQQPHSGLCLDAGSAVGRFAFEMSSKADFTIGLDNSVAFIKAARELMLNRRKTVTLPEEGTLTREIELELPERFDSRSVEFIVGDAQALPFASDSLGSLASLNMLDKVSQPLRHMAEINRTAASAGSQCLISDPFSWSEHTAKQENWLGGKPHGPFSGRGLDNVSSLLEGNGGFLEPVWTIEDSGFVWWKIRTHCNHFELIRSCYIKARR
jgi:uncharacterized protein YbaR (Trm112 family)